MFIKLSNEVKENREKIENVDEKVENNGEKLDRLLQHLGKLSHLFLSQKSSRSLSNF